MSNDKSTWIGVASVVVVIVAVISIMRGCSGSETVRDEPFHGLMAVLAEETSTLLGEQGRVVLIPEDREALNAGFRDAVSRHEGVELVTAELPPSAIPGMMSLSLDAVQQIVDTHPDADAFVSLRGFPPASPDRLAIRGDTPPRWIVVYSTRSPWPADDQPFDLLIAPQPSKDRPEGKPRSARDWFDRYYILLRKS